jgi:chemotaxis signal transduction protein
VSAEATPRPAPRALVFRLGGRMLAAPSGPGGRVLEIDACTRVPTAPPYVLGLANAQGMVLPVIDIGPLLGLRPAPWKWPLFAHLVGGQAMRVAFAVEEVLGFEAYRPDLLEELGEEVPDGLRSFSRGGLGLPLAHAVLIDVPRILGALKVSRPGLPPAARRLPDQLEETSRWKPL